VAYGGEGRVGVLRRVGYGGVPRGELAALRRSSQKCIWNSTTLARDRFVDLDSGLRMDWVLHKRRFPCRFGL
jgi:hypothetical protein